jgi:hypothetical protein
MCPFCLATIGSVVVGTASIGGVAALALKISRKKNGSEEIIQNLNNKEK